MPLHLRDLLPCSIGSPFAHKPTSNNNNNNSSVISPPHSATASSLPSNTAAVQQLHQLQQRHLSSTSSSSSRASTKSSGTLTANSTSQQEKSKVTISTAASQPPQQHQQQQVPKMTERATFAAGCFWGVEKAFQKHFKDENIKTRVGYIGGIDAHPTYKKVCSGLTQHAEALQLEYTPTPTFTYSTLVEFFFRMHDPTTLNAQGPDRGTQYRSAIFAHSPEQVDIAKKVKSQVQEKHFTNKKIVTEVVYKEGSSTAMTTTTRSHGIGVPGGHVWYDAEEYHQKYLDKNPHGYECPSHFLRW